jgi:hypothetical protein
MSDYDAEITSPAPGTVQIDQMGQILVRVYAKGREYPAQVHAGPAPDADQPLQPIADGSHYYEGSVTVPNSSFTLCAKAEWTKASGEIESLMCKKGMYSTS